MMGTNDVDSVIEIDENVPKLLAMDKLWTKYSLVRKNERIGKIQTTSLRKNFPYNDKKQIPMYCY